MRIMLFFIGLLTTVTANAGNADLRLAMERGADFDMRLKVVDDTGNPVSNARCGGWIYLERDKNHGHGYAEYTDTNGCARITGKCSEWIRVVTRKEGYYQTMFEVKFSESKARPIVVDGKWQPYGEERTIILKKIKFPVIMPSSSYTLIEIPKYQEWLKFDLERYCWLPPYGEGRSCDVLLRFHRIGKDMQSDFRSIMEVSFTNNPYAGIYEMGKDSFSEMKSVYIADTNKEYAVSARYFIERHPGVRTSSNILQENSYLVFRTRTKIDDKGNLISAHYGKIYGKWGFHGAIRANAIYFNPTPNDTNLEDAETARRSRLNYKQSLEFEKKGRR